MLDSIKLSVYVDKIAQVKHVIRIRLCVTVDYCAQNKENMFKYASYADNLPVRVLY